MAPDPVFFQYDFTNDQPADIRKDGGAMYPADRTCLLLTKTDTDNDGITIPVTMSWGRATYTKPVPFSSQTTFRTTIKFTVKPKAINAIPGDGLVFFMAPFRHQFPQDPCNGNFGIFDPQSGDAPNVFAVEFSTFLKPQCDPKYIPRLGIDIESRTSKVHTDITDPSYIRHQVTLTITYARGKITATVKTPSGKGFTKSYDYDLSTGIFSGYDELEVGLAASTGDNVAFHEVFTWEFTSTSN